MLRAGRVAPDRLPSTAMCSALPSSTTTWQIGIDSSRLGSTAGRSRSLADAHRVERELRTSPTPRIKTPAARRSPRGRPGRSWRWVRSHPETGPTGRRLREAGWPEPEPLRDHEVVEEALAAARRAGARSAVLRIGIHRAVNHESHRVTRIREPGGVYGQGFGHQAGQSLRSTCCSRSAPCCQRGWRGRVMLADRSSPGRPRASN